MKTIFTLLMVVACYATRAQVLLNEIYPDPGSGNNEFFELYNASTSSTPQSLDNYTIISYFEEGSKKGFNVLDLPNINIAPKSFFVGASSSFFNYQGNSTFSNLNWNDPALSLQNGSLKRWVASTTIVADNDGNDNYNLELIPASFNDFFYYQSGGGASFNVFIYKNGMLVNAFFGGTGGATTVPSNITSMPSLFVDMAGSSPDFTINFNQYNNIPAEYAGQNSGSDNGFIRKKDGVCGTWVKSSSSVNHTPKVSNGKSTSTTGSLTLNSFISSGISPVDSSFITYNVINGPASYFPVTLELYADNGLASKELDASDQFLGSNVETIVTDGPFSTKFFPPDQNILLVAKTSMGCIDQIAFTNQSQSMIILPIKITSFVASVESTAAVLKWQVQENESGNYFEVEKSRDGKFFSKAAIVFNTAKNGSEQYNYQDKVDLNQRYLYRIKSVSKDGMVTYSKTVCIQHIPANTGGIKQVYQQGPSRLNYTYSASNAGVKNLAVYTIMGAKLLDQKVEFIQGENNCSLHVNGLSNKSSYILKIEGQGTSSSAKFFFE